MGLRVFFIKPSKASRRSRLRLLAAGFLFAALIEPRWGFASEVLELHGDYRLTIESIPSPSPTAIVSASPTPSASPSVAPSTTPSAEPTASPTPSVSPSPAAGYALTRPSQVQNMTETSAGVWMSNNFAANHSAVLHFFLPGYVPRGGLLRVTAKVRSNVHIDTGHNLKFIVRAWKDKEGGGSLNHYVCTQISGNPEFTSEQIQQVSLKYDANHQALPWTRAYFPIPQFNETGQIRMDEYRYPTAVGAADGSVKFSVDGSTIFQADHWQEDNAQFPGTPNIVCLQLVYAPISGDAGPLPSNSYVEFSDVSVEVIP